MKTKYLIIGASAAGWSAALTLSNLDLQAEIICITQDTHEPYNKCLLIDNLQDKIAFQDLFLIKDKKILDKIRLIKDTKITVLNSLEKFVQDLQGNKFYFDKLLIATGTSALNCFNLDIKLFHTLEDLEILKKSINRDQDVAIIGAGITGLECADALNKLGVKVALIEKQKNLFENLINENAIQKLEALIKKSGINLITNATILKIDKLKSQKCKLTLNNTLKLEADHVIVCAGTEPNTDFLKNSQLDLSNKLIVVNQHLETNLKDIYAAGDCCAVKNSQTGQLINNRLWPDAVIQGMLAARSMAGQNVIYPAVVKYPTTKLAGETISFSGILKNNT